MTPELTALALAALLQAGLLVVFAIPANVELGVKYTSGPRDRPLPRPLSTVTARLQRAFANGNEALILFTIAVAVVTLSHQSTLLTQRCAWVFLASRVLYIPAYALGWAPWRSAVWGTAFCATMLMILTTLI